MSDNITREPYRNAWYKQLQEEVSKITPYLVPEVENDDNGKILVAGQEGTFGWAQPPEELPVITESDEGKVLKVDDGVPKWLEDQDAEIPTHTASDEGKMLSVNTQNGLEWKNVPDEDMLITVTRSGTSPNYTYSADKTYDEILPYAQKGKAVIHLVHNNNYARIASISGTNLIFRNITGFTSTSVSNSSTAVTDTITQLMCVIQPNNVVNASDLQMIKFFHYITDGELLDDEKYNKILTMMKKGGNVTLMLIDGNNTYALLRSFLTTQSMIFTNNECGIKATIGTDKIVHITEIPKLPTATSADEGKVLMVDANGDYTLGTVQGGSPHYAEVSLGISVE